MLRPTRWQFLLFVMFALLLSGLALTAVGAALPTPGAAPGAALAPLGAAPPAPGDLQRPAPPPAQGTPTPTATAGCGLAWRVVQSSFNQNTALHGVAVVGANDIWAVGVRVIEH